LHNDYGTSLIVDGRGVTQHARKPTEFSSGDAYDAIKPSGRRKSPSPVIVREDVHLRTKQRERMSANAADLARNFSVASWMVRRHLDYVAAFRFNSKSGDKAFDARLEQFIAEQSRRERCDRGGRLNREKMFRLVEARRVLDGDVGLLRLRNGNTQIVESDLIRNPSDTSRIPNTEEWENGVRIDAAGYQLAYALAKRGKGGRGYQYQRTVPRANFYLYGFFERDAANQTRGISPITASLNDFRDVYEVRDYAKAKSKISQLFAAMITQKPGSTNLNELLPTESQNQVEGQAAAEADEPEPRVIDLTKGPVVFSGEEGEDDVKIIESGTDAADFAQQMQTELAICLKGLDIPYCWYDEAYTNYSGSRGSWLLYNRAAMDKRADQIELRQEWVFWAVARGVADGELVLPVGMTVYDVAYRYTEWIPRGMPFWKPSEEVVGRLKAISGGLDNPVNACQESDSDVYENIDKTIAVMKYARDRGVEELGEPLKLSFEAEFPNTTEVVTNGG
jgi:capsid protein